MIKAEQIPDEVWSAFHEAVLRYGYKPQAIAAAINAWPGMDYQPGAMVTKTWRDPGKIILPLPKENNNAG